MMDRARGAGGFTLVELMITVAIVGRLATIARPNYYHMTLRAKRAELPANLGCIRRLEVAYEIEWDTYMDCELTPATSPGRMATDFGVGAHSDHDFVMLGWLPDGRVRGQYMVETEAQGRRFTATGQADIDGNTDFCIFEATHHTNVTNMTANNVF